MIIGKSVAAVLPARKADRLPADDAFISPKATGR
jgi:hypothetical protein